MELKIINLYRKIPLPAQQIKKAVNLLLEKETKSLLASLNLVFVNDREISILNQKFLQHNYPTDVLAFDLGQKKEIVISVDTAIRQAKIFHSSLEYELCLYALHGLLHILGYRDDQRKNRIIMQRKAETVLKRIFKK